MSKEICRHCQYSSYDFEVVFESGGRYYTEQQVCPYCNQGWAKDHIRKQGLQSRGKNAATAMQAAVVAMEKFSKAGR